MPELFAVLPSSSEMSANSSDRWWQNFLSAGSPGGVLELFDGLPGFGIGDPHIEREAALQYHLALRTW